MGARMAVAAVLLALQVFVLTLGNTDTWASLILCAGHVVAAISSRVVLGPETLSHAKGWPWTLTVGVDLVVFAWLQLLGHGGLNYTLLFALPVLMSAILGPRRLALATAAGVTLFLLGDAWWLALTATGEAAPRLVQSGITGTGFFLVALLAHQLAQRLAREEALSQSSQLAARTQVKVNELVIEAMGDGVVVVDAAGVVRTANPAARDMLGDAQGPTAASFLLAGKPYCMELAELVNTTFHSGQAQMAELPIKATPELRRRLRVRSRLTQPPGATTDPRHATGATGEGLCVLFLEDLHELEARVRTEKLAAMGRMSAAVAHEIRNPLSAISQANALLQEDLTDPQQQRLSNMIATHTQRLNRIVDDVLNVARVPNQGNSPTGQTLVLDEVADTVATEWRTQQRSGARVQWLGNCRGARVRFDAEHLRRVLVNLLDNAARYASDRPGAIQVGSRMEVDGALRLWVWSDGLPLEPSVRRHLFEPFFSSESRSSGLGLHLCRELCERHGAELSYQRLEREGRDGNDFYLRLPAVKP